MIERQKWNVILEMPWLAHYDPQINWKIEKMKMTRYPKECRKQWRPKQEKLGWKTQNEKEKKEKEKKRREEKEQRKEEKRKRKPKGERTMEVKRVIEE